MKKILVLAMSCILMLSLVSCGEVKLSTQTVNGISISVPDDMEDFKENNGMMLASGENCSLVITAPSAADIELSAWTADNFAETMGTTLTNVKISNFDNKSTVGGVPAVQVKYTATNSNGQNLTLTSLMMYLKNEQFQMIQITTLTDEDSSVKTNLDTIISSIKTA